MSLAFSLMAAINGSTGSRATLFFGLVGPSLVGVWSGGRGILMLQGWRRKPPWTLLRNTPDFIPQRERRQPPGKLSRNSGAPGADSDGPQTRYARRAARFGVPLRRLGLSRRALRRVGLLVCAAGTHPRATPARAAQPGVRVAKHDSHKMI